MPSTTRRAWWAGLALASAVGLVPSDVFAATARRLGQPISAYSASLFGKTNLSAAQTQTLTCDPDDPLFGSTSVEYDVGIVTVTGYGFGPGYEAWDPPIGRDSDTNLFTPTGFSIEVVQNNEVVMVDLKDFLDNPTGRTETGYIQTFWQLDGVNPTGRYVPPEDQIFLCHNFVIPEGVDTHYLEFKYKDGIPDLIAASYRVYDSTVNRPSGAVIDFMASGNPSEPQFTRPGEIIDAIVAGTAAIPEPASVGILLAAGGLVLVRRSRR